jgi:hypothetical protein
MPLDKCAILKADRAARPSTPKVAGGVVSGGGFATSISVAVFVLLFLLTPTFGEDRSSSELDFRVRSIHGKVVWFAESLERRHGVKSVPESKHRILALETDKGVLYPLVEDKRGRSFRLDTRLRGVPLELLVRQHTGSPLVQVIKILAIEAGGKYELDYWCEICSIAMIELKVCDCCQGPSELRRQKL